MLFPLNVPLNLFLQKLSEKFSSSWSRRRLDFIILRTICEEKSIPAAVNDYAIIKDKYHSTSEIKKKKKLMRLKREFGTEPISLNDDRKAKTWWRTNNLQLSVLFEHYFLCLTAHFCYYSPFCYSHGTMCAGIIAGGYDKSDCGVGVAYDAQIASKEINDRI